MKIQKVIFTIDDNPHYKSFWKSISKHFKTRLNFDSKLFVIGGNPETNDYSTEYGEVEIIEKVGGVPTIIQALIGKFYFTNTELETTWLIGDLDLYPLQQFHFNENIKNINDDKYVHLNPYAYGVNWRNGNEGLAGYFHVAKGKIFENELGFTDKTFKDVCFEIFNSTKWGIMFHDIPGGNENKQASNDWGWFCCEEMYTGEKLRNCEVLVELPPTDISYPRIDRSSMLYNEELLKNNYYIDFHAPRPYENHAEIIESIISKIKING